MQRIISSYFKPLLKYSPFLFLLISFITFAQTTIQTADANINMLRNGTLLVRLKTQENKIIALEKEGQTEWANDIKNKQTEENKAIAEAFKTHFNFCKNFFFIQPILLK